MASPFAKVLAIWNIPNGKTASCGFYVKQTLTAGGADQNYDAGDVEALAQAVYDNYTAAPNMATLFESGVELDRAKAFAYVVGVNADPPPPNEINVETGPFESTGDAIPGSRAGGSLLPNNCSYVVTFRTALASRSGRGRIYLPPLDEADVSASIVDSSYVDEIAAATEAWITGFLGDAPTGKTWTHVIQSLADISPSWHAVTQRVYGSRIDTQRRRLPRGL